MQIFPRVCLVPFVFQCFPFVLFSPMRAAAKGGSKAGPRLLPHVHGAAVRQDIQVAGTAGTMLHPVLVNKAWIRYDNYQRSCRPFEQKCFVYFVFKKMCCFFSKNLQWLVPKRESNWAPPIATQGKRSERGSIDTCSACP